MMEDRRTVIVSDMDLLFQAISLFRRRQYEKCVDLTTRLLEKNSNDQVRPANDICTKFFF